MSQVSEWTSVSYENFLSRGPSVGVSSVHVGGSETGGGGGSVRARHEEDGRGELRRAEEEGVRAS